MSGPQGYDPTQAWQPPQPGQGEQGSEQYPPAWQQPAAPDQRTMQTSGWQQPAYGAPTQYGQQQPTTAYQAPTQQYGQQPASAYGQATQYGQPTQFGQPAQYGQQAQYGQYPQAGQPAQYSPYSQAAPEPGKKGGNKGLGMILGGVGALVLLVVLVTGFWLPGFFVTTKLDVSKAQEGVQEILSDQTNGYGAKNVKDVKCNNGGDPEVKKGDTFDCEVSIDGTKRKVTVTFQDDKGTYEVGRPK